MKIVFQVNGDINKNIAATAVCQAIKTQYPESQLIIFTGFPQVFAGNRNIARVHSFSDTDDFINYKYKKRQDDTLFFLHDPCQETDYINKRSPLVQVWCEMFHIPYNGEQPELFTDNNENAANIYILENNKIVMIDEGILKNANNNISKQ